MSGEALAHIISQHLREIVSVVDADERILYVNQATESALGSSPDDFPGRDAAAWVHPDDLAGVREHQRRLLSEPGSTSTIINRVKCADGSWTRMSTHGINLLHDPVVRGVLQVSLDVEQQCRDQDAFEQSMAAQRLVADLGLQALVSSDLEGLLTTALTEVGALLEVTWVLLHEVDDAGMRMRHMIGPDSLEPGQP